MKSVFNTERKKELSKVVENCFAIIREKRIIVFAWGKESLYKNTAQKLDYEGEPKQESIREPF